MAFSKLAREFAKLYSIQATMIIALFWLLSRTDVYEKTNAIINKFNMGQNLIYSKKEGRPTDAGRILHGTVLVLSITPLVALAGDLKEKLLKAGIPNTKP